MFPCKLFKGCMLYMQTGSIELFSNQVYRLQCAYFRLDLNIELVGLPGGNMWLFMQWLCRKSCPRCVQSSHGRDISLAVYTTPQNKFPGIPYYMQRTYSVALCMLGRGQTAFGWCTSVGVPLPSCASCYLSKEEQIPWMTIVRSKAPSYKWLHRTGEDLCHKPLPCRENWTLLNISLYSSVCGRFVHL